VFDERVIDLRRWHERNQERDVSGDAARGLGGTRSLPPAVDGGGRLWYRDDERAAERRLHPIMLYT